MRKIILINLCLSMAISIFAQTKPKSAVTYYNRGVAKAQLQDYRGALEYFGSAIYLNPKYEKAYSMRGNAKSDLQDYRGAIADFNIAIEINPKYGVAYKIRGLAKALMDDKEGSCLDWSKAGELGVAEAYDLIKQHCQ
jgi:tetratricopeptide (TPR) repeat protein